MSTVVALRARGPLRGPDPVVPAFTTVREVLQQAVATLASTDGAHPWSVDRAAAAHAVHGTGATDRRGAGHAVVVDLAARRSARGAVCGGRPPVSGRNGPTGAEEGQDEDLER